MQPLLALSPTTGPQCWSPGGGGKSGSPASGWADQVGPLLRAQGAILYSRQGRFDLGLPLFQAAIEEAEARGDARTTSLIWDQLGHELLMLGRLNEAEHALVEAFRQRKLNRFAEVGYSYYTLGRLRLAQGDAVGADRLFSESIASLTRTGGTLAAWRIYYERGRARMESQRLVEALSDFQNARELARRVRLQVLPADSVWITPGWTGRGSHRS